MTKYNHCFKRFAGVLLSAAVLFSTAVLPAVSAADGIVVEDFETITALSQNSIFTYSPVADSYANIEDGALHFGKTGAGSPFIRIDLTEAIGTMQDYTVSFDYTGAFTGSSMNVKLGACFALENAADTAVAHPNPPSPTEHQYVLEWWNGDPAVKNWDKSDKTTYDLSNSAQISLLVKNREKLDIYIDGELAEQDLLYRDTPFTRLDFQMNGGLRGEAVLDNFTVSEGTTPPVPKEVLYTQDFSEMTDIEDTIFSVTNLGTANATAVVADGELKVEKTVGASGAVASFSADFSSYLTDDIDDYLVSFDVRSDLSVGGSFNLFLGGCVAIKPQADQENKIIVEWHDGSTWHKDDKTLYGSSDGSNIKLVIHGQEKMDLYIDNTLVKADIPQRPNNLFTTLRFELSQWTTGAFYLDNFLLTTNTTVEEENPPQPPEIENAVNETDVPVVGAPAVAKENFDLYLAIGQSNMAGRAPMYAEDRIFIPNAYLFNADGQWETAQAQYDGGSWKGMNRYSTVQKTGAQQGLSPAFYFAKVLAEQVGSEQRKIGIISNARGDTSLAQWQKDYTSVGSREDFDLYEQAVERAKAAMEKGTLKGIIWHQGCADLGTDPVTYISTFAEMVRDLRTDLGIADLPIIIGEIPGYGNSETTINNRMKFNRQCIAKLPDNVTNCWAISSAGSRDIGDKTHFDTAAQRRLGNLYGQTALEKIYHVAQQQDNFVSLQNITATAGENSAGYAADTVASVHSWDDASTYWKAEKGASWSAEFGETLALTELKSYFLNPYNYVVQYKIYLGNNGIWTPAIDHSGITSYEKIDALGAVIDNLEGVMADSIKIEITGIVDYDKKSTDAIIGCHEFALYTSDVVQGTRLSFRGYAGEAEFTVGEVDTLELNATSPSGIQDIKVYANGVLMQTLTTSPYILDISVLGIGRAELRAVAVAKDGSTAETVLKINIVGMLDHAFVNDKDFESENSNTLKSGIMLYPQRGYVKVDSIDQAHGNSLLVGIEKANEEYSSGNLPYINVPLGGISDEFSLFCDLYVDAKENSGDKRLSIYQASGNETILLRFANQMTMGSNGTGAIDYDTGRWYSFRIDFDIAKHTATVYRDGVQIGSPVALGANLVSANYIRLYGPRNDTVPSFTAIDNLRVVKYYRIPSILSVGNENVVAAGEESFTVRMDDDLYGASITSENVWLLDNEGRKCSLREVKWSSQERAISAIPVRKLANGSSYTFVLGGKVELSPGVPIRFPVRAAFRTAAMGVGITSVQLTEESGEKKAVVNLQNVSDSAVNGFVVMTLWNGNVFCGMAIQACALSAGGTQELTLTHLAPAGASVEICIYDSLSVPQLLGGSVFRGR